MAAELANASQTTQDEIEVQRERVATLKKLWQEALRL